MFENMTFEYLLEKMLEKIPDNMDKREGSIIYDALAPCALELQQIYIVLDIVIDNSFADTASWEYLVKRAAERGLLPYSATKAVLQGEFAPAEIEVPIGSRFFLDTNYYTVIKKDSDGLYQLECDEEGEIGNNLFGELIPVDYISGLESAELTSLIVPGEEEESEDSIRNRYFSSFSSQAFGGNIADYQEKVNKIIGVGGVKVYPTWNGGGTVKLVIIASDYKKPSKQLIDMVQTIVDPIQNQGDGFGIAPIGHSVTVEGVEEIKIDLKMEITYQNGWSWKDVKPYAEQAIDGYFNELASNWEKEELVIRISQIETRLLNLTGVVDIANTSINGEFANLILESNLVPLRGDLIG